MKISRFAKAASAAVPQGTSHVSFQYPRDSRGVSHFRFSYPRDSRGLSHFNFHYPRNSRRHNNSSFSYPGDSQGVSHFNLRSCPPHCISQCLILISSSSSAPSFTSCKFLICPINISQSGGTADVFVFRSHRLDYSTSTLPTGGGGIGHRPLA